MIQIVLAVVLLWLAYKWYMSAYEYWRERGLKYVPGTFPWGSAPDIPKLTRYQGHALDEVYNALSPHPYGGFYIARRPFLLLRDPEIIKHILLKDFQFFQDRQSRVGDPKKNPLIEHLFAIEGERWRPLRIKLSPTFTSGKLKLMFPLFELCASQLDEHLHQIATTTSELDVKDMIARFTTDVIGNCAFGLDINSIKNPNNQFRIIGNKVFPQTIPLERQIKSLLFQFFPFLDSKLKVSLFPKDVTTYFLKIVEDTVKYREVNNIKRNDFLDLLIQLKNKGFIDSDKDVSNEGKGLEMTIGLLAAQCFVFFLAGYETSSSVTSYCLYELAQNSVIQEKLWKEIDEVSTKYGGLTYAALQEMHYLDQVISETIRKYPTLPILTRICTTSYRMPDDPSIVIEKGTRVMIPTYSLHHDPKYFPKPDVFDPDRFSPENKKSIPQFAYLPFGDGPRICIGMRFGQLQTRMGIASVISKYKLFPTENTPEKLSFAASAVISVVKGDIKLGIKLRN